MIREDERDHRERRWTRRAHASLVARLIVTSLLVLLPAGGEGQVPPVGPHVSYLVGLAKVKHGSAGQEERLAQGMSVRTGDILSTLKGTRLEIKLANGSQIRVGEKSVFTVEEVGVEKLIASTRPLEAAGDAKVWVRAEKAKQGGEIAVKTPVVLTAVKGTIFHLRLAADLDATRVRVYEGATTVVPLETAPAPAQPDSVKTPLKIGRPTPVEGPHQVTLEEYTVLVKALQEVTITRAILKTKQDARPFDPAEDKKDDWVLWNLQRDAEASGPEVPPPGNSGN